MHLFFLGEATCQRTVTDCELDFLRSACLWSAKSTSALFSMDYLGRPVVQPPPADSDARGSITGSNLLVDDFALARLLNPGGSHDLKWQKQQQEPPRRDTRTSVLGVLLGVAAGGAAGTSLSPSEASALKLAVDLCKPSGRPVGPPGTVGGRRGAGQGAPGG